MTRRTLRLAWLLLAPVIAPSCLVSTKQDFPAPPQTPPFLSAGNAKPTLQRLVINADGLGQIVFDTTLRSEDDGAKVQALLVVDDIFASPLVVLDQATLAPSTFSDTTRHVTLTFDPKKPPLIGADVAPGCHRFTMLVSHAFHFYSTQPLVDGDQDFLVWWVVQGDPNDPSFAGNVAATSCPP